MFHTCTLHLFVTQLASVSTRRVPVNQRRRLACAALDGGVPASVGPSDSLLAGECRLMTARFRGAVILNPSGFVNLPAETPRD
jgi:hypothetical protein